MSKPLADALFSKVRQSVLGLLFGNSHVVLHLREIARLTGFSAPTVRLELDSLTAAGILTDERQGNQRLFRANQNCPVFEELQGIARKTFGLADRIRTALEGIEGIEIAFIFGSVASGEERAESDVDVFVIGECSYHEVVLALYEVGKYLRREINPQHYTAEEFAARFAEGNAFVHHVSIKEELV